MNSYRSIRKTDCSENQWKVATLALMVLIVLLTKISPSIDRYFHTNLSEEDYVTNQQCVHSGEIGWCHGPFNCGSYPDLRIFRLRLNKLLLESNEKAIADRGYRDGVCVTPDKNPKNEELNRIRARGETANGRLTSFLFFRIVFDTTIQRMELASTQFCLCFN